MKAFILTIMIAASTGAAEAQNTAVPADTTKSPAEIRAEQLDQLFGALHSLDAKDAKDLAARTEERIWALWTKSDSPTADLLLSQATAAMKAEAFDASEDMLNQVILSYGTYAEAYYQRAALYFRMKRFTQALSDLDTVLELEPRHFAAMTGRGMIYREQGKRDLALAAFRDALAVNPYLETAKLAIKEMNGEQPEL